MHREWFTKKGKVAIALSLIEGHHRFIQKNTGETLNGQVQHFIFNNENVNANNRHFTNLTAMQGYANGYGTTEGQALSILGWAYAYLATGNTKYLEYAEMYFQAYLDCFYVNHSIPATPERWKAHWSLNAKEPVLANYPLNAANPALGGFKAVMITYTNGNGVIPSGAPYYGQYLDKATFAYDGQLSWDSIEGDVVKINSDGTIDWQKAGIQTARVLWCM